MKLLLDTHIWIWYSLGNPRLSSTLQKALANEENELWLSPISLWETLILAEKGRLTLEPTPEKWIEKILQELDIKEATLTNDLYFSFSTYSRKYYLLFFFSTFASNPSPKAEPIAPLRLLLCDRSNYPRYLRQKNTNKHAQQ
jgi:hypothetical protein